MFNRKGSGDDTNAKVTGRVDGQVAIGRDIRQHMSVVTVTPEDRAELRRALDELRAQVATQAPAEHAEPARKLIDELEAAIAAPQPKVSTIAYVREWFARNVPSLAGSVASLVGGPLVGKLVAAAGDAAVEQFTQLLGSD